MAPTKTPEQTTGTGQRIRPVPAVTRAIAILRLLGRTKEPLNAKSIADALDLVPSTCLHILRVLVSENLLVFDKASKRYRLGSGMLILARSVMDTDLFSQFVQPFLDQISDKWTVTALGVEVIDTRQMIVTALSRSSLPFRLHVDIGSRFPGLISATGRLVAAYSDVPDEDLEQQFNKLRWQQAISFSEWKKELDSVQDNGYSIDNGYYISGVTLIAVPILNNHQRITHTIVVAGIKQQLSGHEQQSLIQELQECAAQTSGLLYPR